MTWFGVPAPFCCSNCGVLLYPVLDEFGHREGARAEGEHYPHNCTASVARCSENEQLEFDWSKL